MRAPLGLSESLHGSLAIAIGLCSLACGCHRKDVGAEEIVLSATCLRCGAPASLGTLTSKEMDETSGLVASGARDGLYFAHNDSGDVARFFALGEHGEEQAAFTFATSAVTDCEDMARGPCAADAGAAATCLFVGDIGDNFRLRSTIDVYRVREPEVIANATLPSDRFALKYPDGAHDAETLLVHPRTGAITIVTKEKGGASSVFEAPPLASPGPPILLTKVGTLRAPAGSPLFTGGSVHPEGRGILLRTYTHVFFAPMTPDQTVAEALRAPLCSLPSVHERQGEAIAWRRDGTGFVTTSEGVGVSVNQTRCEGP
jgi:hypothetical protein